MLQVGFKVHFCDGTHFGMQMQLTTLVKVATFDKVIVMSQEPYYL
jgi:hypothetical protein